MALRYHMEWEWNLVIRRGLMKLQAITRTAVLSLSRRSSNLGDIFKLWNGKTRLQWRDQTRRTKSEHHLWNRLSILWIPEKQRAQINLTKVELKSSGMWTSDATQRRVGNAAASRLYEVIALLKACQMGEPCKKIDVCHPQRALHSRFSTLSLHHKIYMKVCH